MSKTVELERQNRLNLAYREKAKELDRALSPMERKEIRERIDAEIGYKEVSDNGDKDWRSHAITQADLFKTKLSPLEFLVKDLLITPGLCVLGGRKKLGKSRLALDLAQRIASGTDFLGREVKQGRVVVLSLEDGTRRLQQRVHELDSTKDLPILYLPEFRPLNTPEGLSDFEDMLKTEAPALVVIDTLISCVDKTLDENKASDMASLLNPLHALALAYSTTIIVIHHFGKKSYSDAGFDQRGSSATPSATDCNIGLYKVSDGCYDLKVEGRDIADCELRLYFDPETMTFQLKGDARDERRAMVEDRITEIIGELGEADAGVVAKELNISRIAARGHLSRMKDNKQLDSKLVPTGRTQKIVFFLPETMVTPITPYTDNKDTVKEVNTVINVKKVKEVKRVSKKERCNEVTNVTPISEVKAKEIASDVIQVAGFRTLGQTEGFKCKDTSGYCAIQSKYTKQPFHCGYTPGKSCPHWSKANE